MWQSAICVKFAFNRINLCRQGYVDLKFKHRLSLIDETHGTMLCVAMLEHTDPTNPEVHGGVLSMTYTQG